MKAFPSLYTAINLIIIANVRKASIFSFARKHSAMIKSLKSRAVVFTALIEHAQLTFNCS